MKFDFLLCGSPDDAFYAQFSMFRKSLDALGGAYRDARLVVVFGAGREIPLPVRWEPYFDRIEIVWADCDEYRRVETFAQSDLRFELIRPGADVAFICDADTLMMSAFPQEFLSEMVRAPFIGAVIAHYPFPIDFAGDDLQRKSFDSIARALTQRWPRVHATVMRRFPFLRRFLPILPGMHTDDVWEILGRRFLDRSPDMSFGYTLQPEGQRLRCPFYINYGFLAGTPSLLATLYDELRVMQPEIATTVGESVGFYGQTAIALVVDKLGLRRRALPMRFNYPNDPIADQMYPDEMADIVLLHYLRTELFDRHRVFSIEKEFERFLSLDLAGSNRSFQHRARAITGGAFPFSRAV